MLSYRLMKAALMLLLLALLVETVLLRLHLELLSHVYIQLNLISNSFDNLLCYSLP